MAVVPAPRPSTGAVLLLFVSAAWGSAFPLMDDLINRLPFQDLLAERYLLAALTLFLIRPSGLRGLSRSTWIQGALLGLMFGVGQNAQAWGLHGLSSSVSGFAVGCNVIFTPLLGMILFKVHVSRRIWLAVALALAGLTSFTLIGAESGKLYPVALGATIAAAILYAAHTLVLGRMSVRKRQGFNAYAVSVIQLAVIGLLSGALALPDGIQTPDRPGDWLILAHLSVVSCALGFLARSYGQRHVPAVPAAILMSSQPLWVAAISVLWFGEHIDGPLVLGGGLTAAAMVLAVSARQEPPRPPGYRRPIGPPPPPPQGKGLDPNLLAAALRARAVLAELRRRREDPIRLGEPEPVHSHTLVACANVEGCPWQAVNSVSGQEPSLDRLIARASSVVRAQHPDVPDCCRSVTLVGTCLCQVSRQSPANRSLPLVWPPVS